MFRTNRWKSIKIKSGCILLLFAMSFLLMQSCGKKAVLRKYYLVELPAVDEEDKRVTPLTDASCEVIAANIPPAFSKPRIPLRVRSHELTYYFYHQWTVNPEESFTHLLETYLKNKHIFANVSRRVWNAVPKYQIVTYIYQLEAVEETEILSAHLSIKIQLIQLTDNKIVVTHSSDEKLPLAEKDINLFAATISNMYHENLRKFADKIENYLAIQQTDVSSYRK